MNREDIIRMAREAGFEVYETDVWITDGWWLEELERFAALIAAAARAEENEACAKVCEQVANALSAWPIAYEGLTAETKFVQRIGETIGQPFIEAIRARGQP